MDAARKLHILADYVDVRPNVCGGRPHIRGTRVRVSEVVSRHAYQEESVDDIVEALPQLTLAQVHAALAYYYDNHDEVEAELRAEDEFVLRMAGRYAPPPGQRVISFYTDENVDQRIIHGLRRRGVDVLTAQEAGLRGTIPDVQYLEFAIARARTLLHRRYRPPGDCRPVERARSATPTPVNRFPDFLHHIVARLKTTCPLLGQLRVANLLARAGLRIGATTVRRCLTTCTPPPAPFITPAAPKDVRAKSPRTVKSRAPNHTWNVDITTLPTGGGFWVPWLPWALVQRWPFCWWVAVVFDHFSRTVIAAGVWAKQPTAIEICALLDGAVRKTGRAPKYTISDQGVQFREEYLDWCSWHEVKPRFGAVGRYGSIAVLERFFRSMKQECFRRILVPYARDAMVRELDSFTTWYNQYRPHMGLAGATPDEIYRGARSARDGLRFEPRPKSPARGRKLRARKGTHLNLAITRLHGKAHLPIIELRAA